MTFQTKWCRRMFREVPFVGCGCVDCRVIRTWRRFSRWFGIAPDEPKAAKGLNR